MVFVIGFKNDTCAPVDRITMGLMHQCFVTFGSAKEVMIVFGFELFCLSVSKI